MDLDSANDIISPGDTVARSKSETDIEQHVLGTKVKLSDGTEALVFNRTPRNKDLLFGYSCHICGVACLYGERMLQIHIAGRKHQARLNVTVFDAEQYRASLVTKPKANTASTDTNSSAGAMGILENESSSSTKTLAKLQNVLDGYRDGPLVGLEYIIELTDTASGNDPFYSCILCNMHNNNESGITTHMIGLGHRFKFLEKHYPSVRKILAPYRNNNLENGGQVFFRVVQTVCEAIEDHHGRLTPHVYDASDFNRNRVKYGQQISFGSHFDERTGPKFGDVIDAKVLQDLLQDMGSTDGVEVQVQGGDAKGPSGEVKAQGGDAKSAKRYRKRDERGSLDSISSVSSANSMLTISSSGDNDDRSRQRPRSPLNGGRQRAVQRSLHSGPPERQLIPTPRELSQQSAAIAHERYKWEKYRCSVDIAVTQLTKQLKDYEKNPEKHPLYSEEWKKFWNRRYKELQAEKKDPQKHNFKPEWIEFWTKRMKDLHEEDIARKKEEIRMKMNLPVEGEERTDELREQYVLRVPQAKRARTGDPKAGTVEAPILIDVNSDEEEDDYKGGQPMRRSKRSPRTLSRHHDYPRKRSTSRSHRSRSPISDDNDYDTYSRSRSHRVPPKDYRGERSGDSSKHRGPPPERVDYDEWAKNYYGPNKKVFVRTEFDADNTTPLNFIAVCRLLTAFEEYLGSLGPKVIDLLAKALALEKVKANSADDLLLNEDNCMFLETVKEKLKGHMMAETIDPPKIVPIKKAVRNIARLLHEASKREQPDKAPEEELSRDSLPASEVAAVPTTTSSAASGTNLDKLAVAEQLAKLLVAQGKADFTTEELEELINVYVAMAQMSRERNTIINAKSYMAALPQPAVSSAPTEVSPVAAAPAAPSKAPVVPERARPEASSSRGTAARLNEKKNDIPVRTGNFSSAMPIMDEENSSPGPLENLTDSDLQTLLQSFKDLSNDEQMHLISYLRKLERTEPDRVELLRRYVNFDSFNNPPVGDGRNSRGDNGNRRDVDNRLSDIDELSYTGHDDDSSYDMFRPSGPTTTTGGRNPVQMPSSNNAGQQRLTSQRPQQQQQLQQQQQQRQKITQQQSIPPQKKPNTMIVDSEDEDDYSYDDILRAASKNVSTIPQQPRSKSPTDAYDTSSNHSQRTNSNNDAGSGGPGSAAISLTDTQNLIANLMESLQKSVSDANSHKPSGTGSGAGGTSNYTNPITTIGTPGSEGSATSIPGKVSNPSSNPSAMYPSFPQQQGQAGMGMLYGQGQQPMGHMQGTPGQMQPQFGGQFMYQGQMFGGNAAAQQQMQQYGYGNYGYY
ncbi:uncharacterized protein CG7065-like isoform X2 [Anopheles moucheti]|uniref:uncharacterized protein CG7065-like isoform X2 n=1 Tax=Anopheles moucheti TaxID=186751 RepID=UPI0022F00225|nr:uncharacterized protein CG7065-like isoform X2 [Anopheles moucheti]